MNLVRSFVLSLGLVSVSVPAFATSFNIDKDHSTILFRVKHMGTSHTYGVFKDFEGTYDFDAKDVSKSKFDVTIKSASIDTFVDKRNDHLKSPDFFNVKQFPTITFKSTAVKGTEAAFEISGNLTLNGATKPVVIKAEKVGEGKDKKGIMHTGWDGTLTIKRSEFGVSYGVPDAVSDEVAITIAVEGVAK